MLKESVWVKMPRLGNLQKVHSMVFQILFLCMILSPVLSSSQGINHNRPVPYQYGYHTQTDHGTNFREEQGDGQGSVRGSYGYTDPNGTYREVHYVADHLGFRAEIKTNEQGTTNDNPADIRIHSSGDNSHRVNDGKPELQNFYHFRVPDHELMYNNVEERTSGRSAEMAEEQEKMPLPLELAKRKGEHGGHE